MSEKYDELCGVLKAVTSERDARVRQYSNRSARRKRIGQLTDEIRTMRVRLMQATQELHRIRRFSDEVATFSDIDAMNERIKQLRGQIATEAAVRRVAQLAKLMAQIAELEELEQMMGAGDPDAIGEEQIIS